MEELSKVEQYVIFKGWKFVVDGDEVQLETCPFCQKENHFSINKETEQSNCFRCGKGSKSLDSLKKKLGDRIDGVFDTTRRVTQPVVSAIDAAQIASQHQALLEDDAALDYLVSERGFTMKVIRQQKLGLTTHFFKKVGKTCPALVIPYFRGGKPIYVKYRTLPPESKDFISTQIDDLPLYNEVALSQGHKEIWAVEGESDALAMMSAGIHNVIGIPGAGTKKTEWVTQIDDAKLDRINICYDNDEAGQKNVKDMAAKIGIDKTYIVKLPEFETVLGDPGKDINDFLRRPDGLQELLKLRDRAKLLEISGVFTLAEILEDQQAKLERGENLIPEFDTPWRDLTAISGRFDRGDVIGITAQAKTGKTTVAINWLDYYVNKKYSAFMYCLEMRQEKLVSKWMSLLLEKPEIVTTTIDVGGVLVDVPRPNFTVDDYKLLREKIAAMESDFLFGYTNFKTADDIFETIYQTKRRYGIDVMAFDNLHLLAREIEHRSSEIDNLSKRFKQIAMELKILEILIMQPTKANKDGSLTSFEDTRGSVAPTQDVDCGIALSRIPKQQITMKDVRNLGRIDFTDAYEPQIIATIKYARNAPGGACTLKFDGAISKVTAFEVSP